MICVIGQTDKQTDGHCDLVTEFRSLIMGLLDQSDWFSYLFIPIFNMQNQGI